MNLIICVLSRVRIFGELHMGGVAINAFSDVSPTAQEVHLEGVMMLYTGSLSCNRRSADTRLSGMYIVHARLDAMSESLLMTITHTLTSSAQCVRL